MSARHCAICCGLMLGLVGTASTCLQAGAIELKSGDGAIGTMDPLVDFSTNWGASFQDSYIIASHSEYQTIAGTHWISVSSDGATGPAFSSNILFRAVFDLPTGYSSPSFTISVHADNSARVFLNGVLIGEQEWDSMGLDQNFQGAPEVFSTSNGSLFLTGQNVLDIQLYNGLVPLGLDYLATVTFVPEPGDALILMPLLALIGCGCRRAKRRGHSAAPE